MYPRFYEFSGGHYPDYCYWNSYSWGYPGHYYFGYSGDSGQQQERGIARNVILRDYGANPLVIDIEDAAEQNQNFRAALWTGKNLQVVLMSLRAGEDIGLEAHQTHDQFLRIEEGEGMVQMGDRPDNLYVQQLIEEDDAIIVPAGTWHNITNTGHKPLKLYTIYAPPEHPFGTVHVSKQAAMAAEHNGG